MGRLSCSCGGGKRAGLRQHTRGSFSAHSSFLVSPRDQIEYLVKQLTVPEEEGSALQLVDENLSLSGK